MHQAARKPTGTDVKEQQRVHACAFDVTLRQNAQLWTRLKVLYYL